MTKLFPKVSGLKVSAPKILKFGLELVFIVSIDAFTEGFGFKEFNPRLSLICH